MTIAESIRSRKQALTVLEFAELMGTSKFSVYKLIKQRGLPSIRMGASIRLDPVQTSDWLEAHTTVKIPRRQR
jgi:excisionase family DNA binding protein